MHRVGQPPHEKAAAFVDFLTAWVSARLKRHSRRSAKPRNFYISARVRLYTPRLVNCGEWHVQVSCAAAGDCRDEWPLWVAPALQDISGDFCGRFCQYRRLCGLFMRWGSAGLDEFRERGSNRLIGLEGPLPFPECPCSWLTYFRIITSTSCISWRLARSERGLPVFLFLCQHRPDGPCRFVRHSGRCQSEWLVCNNLLRPQINLFRRTFRHDRARCHADDQQLADVAVSLLGDLAQALLAATGFVERGEPKPRRQITPGSELMRIANRGDNR